MAGDPKLPGQLGVKTFEHIKRGTLVTFYLGELITTEESDVRQKVSGRVIVSLGSSCITLRVGAHQLSSKQLRDLSTLMCD